MISISLKSIKQYTNVAIFTIGLLVSGCTLFSPEDNSDLIQPSLTSTTIALTDTPVAKKATDTPEMTSIVVTPTKTNIEVAQVQTLITVVNAHQLQSVSQVNEENASSFVWLNNGDAFSIATGSYMTTYQRFPSVQVAVPRLETDNPMNIISSKENNLLAWSDETGKVFIWNAGSDDAPMVISEYQSPITSLAFDQDGNTIAIATYDGALGIWDVPDAKLETSWQFPQWLSNLSFSPDSSTLGGVDVQEFAILMIDIETGETIRTLQWTDHASPVLYEAQFSPDWKTIAWVARGTIRLMDVESEEYGPTLSHEDFVGSIAWSPDSLLLATSSAATVNQTYAPVVNIWDVTSGETVNVLIQDNPTVDVEFSPTGAELGTLNYDQGLIIWSIK